MTTLVLIIVVIGKDSKSDSLLTDMLYIVRGDVKILLLHLVTFCKG